MSIKDDLVKKLDVDKNGKVNLADAIRLAEDRWGALAVRFGAGGFAAGLVLGFVLSKLIGK